MTTIEWLKKIKEMEEERDIELIQFLSTNKEFKEYNSLSKETAKYFLDIFKKD